MEDNAVLRDKSEKRRGWKWRYLLLPFLIYFVYAFAIGDGWLLYREGSYRGTVVDSDTGEPIEGAVVVAVYHINEIFFHESFTDISSVKEVLTDKNGEFYIPSHVYFDPYPVAIGDITTFIIYKPGYTAYPGPGYSYYGYLPDSPIVTKMFVGLDTVEEYFKKGVTVPLMRLETKEERLKNIPGGPGDMGADKLPLLYKAINEEGKRFGLGEVR